MGFGWMIRNMAKAGIVSKMGNTMMGLGLKEKEVDMACNSSMSKTDTRDIGRIIKSKAKGSNTNQETYTKENSRTE